MRKFSVAVATAAVLTAGTPSFGAVQLVRSSPGNGLPAAIESVTEKLNTTRMASRYCWYDNAWNGPGWYRCGYARHEGQGWGGPRGRHDWRGKVTICTWGIIIGDITTTTDTVAAGDRRIF